MGSRIPSARALSTLRIAALGTLAAACFGACDPAETKVLGVPGGAGGGAGASGASIGSSGAAGATAGAGSAAGSAVAAGAAGLTGTAGNAGSAGTAGDTGSAGTGGSAPATTSCKRGLAYGEHSVDDLKAESKGIGWWYNWSPGPDDAAVAAAYAALGMEFVPMIWSEKDLVPERLARIPADAKYLLGFNEPNFKKGQANLSPQQAAALWPQVEAVAKARNLSLVSPALNFCGPAENCWNTDPFDWFDAFFAACPTCRVDYVAVHWYACTKDALSWYLDKLKTKYGKPIWLTEFSCLDDAGQKNDPTKQSAYMKDALTLLEADPMVFRYAWFIGRWNDTPAINLLGKSGELTSLGSQYVTSPGACTP